MILILSPYHTFWIAITCFWFNLYALGLIIFPDDHVIIYFIIKVSALQLVIILRALKGKSFKRTYPPIPFSNAIVIPLLMGTYPHPMAVFRLVLSSFVDKFAFFPLAGITSFDILDSDEVK